MTTRSLLLLSIFSPFFMVSLWAQGPKQRAVEVSAIVQENPPQIHFSWAWDWSGPDYTIYKKLTHEPNWGEPIAILEWSATEFVDTDVEIGVPYEYAFFKKKWGLIKDTIELIGGMELNFTINNLYGDGLCCNFGHGWYKVEACGEVLAEGSDFGTSQSTTFRPCGDVTGGNVEVIVTINPDMQTNNTWWELTNTQTGAIIADSGGQGVMLDERPKYGFIYTGIQLPTIENRGSILLLIDDILVTELQVEIEQLKLDLIGDGWKVKKMFIKQAETVEQLKAKIQQAYSEISDLKSLFLLGHIPVPYSGSFYADGHIENHWGAWPADVFYGELDGEWTDETVNNTSAFLTANHNVPGDGKYDQSAIPSKVELQIGRVDMHQMDAFGSNEVELLRAYLNKNHHYKIGQVPVVRRALIDDNLNLVLASPAASAWRNFATLFGAENIHAEEVDYFPSMSNQSYLWAYGCGSGTHQSCNGIGTTTDFANANLKNIFTMLLGSQFGDWDNANNFLRAPLASGQTLASAWVGNPPWTIHHTAMGFTIGEATLITQNSDESNYYPGPQLVHIALMGDPSLRIHPVKPPENVSISSQNNAVQLSWEAPQGENVLGYYIYKTNDMSNGFERVNENWVPNTFFIDESPQEGKQIYMVRTLKLETSGSGTYYNLSLGSIDSTEVVLTSSQNLASNAWIKVFPNPTNDYLQLFFNDQFKEEVSIELLLANGQLIFNQKIEVSKQHQMDISKLPPSIYWLRLKSESFNWVEKVIVGN